MCNAHVHLKYLCILLHLCCTQMYTASGMLQALHYLMADSKIQTSFQKEIKTYRTDCPQPSKAHKLLGGKGVNCSCDFNTVSLTP